MLFDLDGTLVDSVDLILASYAHAGLAVLGAAPAPDEARRWIGRGLVDIYGGYPPEQSAALIAAYREFNAAHFEAMTQRYPGLPELLRRLVEAGVRCAVATSKGRGSAQASLDFAGLSEFVEIAATAETTETHKPDPAPLLAAAAHLGVTPETMVYVGDAVVDCQAARAAGMASVLVTWGAGTLEDLRRAAPDGLVDDAAQLARLLLPPTEAETPAAVAHRDAGRSLPPAEGETGAGQPAEPADQPWWGR